MADLTDEQKEQRRAQLAKGRETAKRNREEKQRKLADQAQARVAAPEAVAAEAEAAEVLLDEPVAALDARAERRTRLLAGLDQETADLISDDELEAIEAEERGKALEAKKKTALRDVRASAQHHARVEHDLIPSDTLRTEAERSRLNQPVKFRIDLPGDGAGHRGQNGVRVDGMLYQVGHIYTRPRAVYESIREIIYRAHLNEIRFVTLDQHKAGQSAHEVMARRPPQIEVLNAA